MVFFVAKNSCSQSNYPIELVLQNSNLREQVVISKDEKYVAAYNKMGNIIDIYHIPSGKKIKTFRSEFKTNIVDFSFDSKQLFVGGDNTQKNPNLCSWDLERSTCTNLFSDVSNFEVSKDGKYMVLILNRKLALWNIERKIFLLKDFEIGKGSYAREVKIAPDNSAIALRHGILKDEKSYICIISFQGNIMYTLSKKYEMPTFGFLSTINDFYVIDKKVNTIDIWNLDKKEIRISSILKHKHHGGTYESVTEKVLYYNSSGGWRPFDYVNNKELAFGNGPSDFALFNNEKCKMQAGDPISIWDSENSRYLGKKIFSSVSSLLWSDEHKSLFFATDAGTNVLDLKTLNYSYKLEALRRTNVEAKIISDKHSGQILVLRKPQYNPEVEYIVKNPFTNKELYSGKIVLKNGNLDKQFLLSVNGGFFLIMESNSNIVRYDLKTGKISGEYLISESTKQSQNEMICSSKGDFFVVSSIKNTQPFLTVIDTKGMAPINTLYYSSNENLVFTLSSDNKTIAIRSWNDSWIDGTSQLRLYNIADKTPLLSYKMKKDFLPNLAFSSNSKYIAYAESGEIHILDLKTLQEFKKIITNSASIRSLSFIDNDNYLVINSSETNLSIYNLNNNQRYSLVPCSSSQKDWIFFSDDGYWEASSNGGELVAMVQGLNCWNIDQKAYKYNRPDILLKRLAFAEDEVIKHFERQNSKRLRKLGIDNSDLQNEFASPYISNFVKSKTTEKVANLKATLYDDNYPLKSYNIFINDVPIYGIKGIEISGNKYELDDLVELGIGDNKIEVSCVNQKGIESNRSILYDKFSPSVRYTNTKKRNLYFIGFGVSKYKDSKLNLQFAHKDVLDLEKVLLQFKNKEVGEVFTKVLINEQVTPVAIKEAKDFLKNAQPDDTFILFIAGHGLHDRDEDATYYFLTHNTDLNNLKGTAADFEAIEDLLQGIHPRNKLFLMDACESGEIDEEDQGQMIAAATGVGIASRGFKSNTPVIASEAKQSQPTAKRAYLYQKDRYIYNDLVRRSGAIVFSSSKGGELSYERSDIENGLFTEYIMKALTTTEADKDGNGTVSTDELRQYVSEQVAKASGDLQHPTVDRDNIYQKFGFGVE